MYTSINLSQAGPIATITLARPDLHNAFDAAMIGELHDCLYRAGGRRFGARGGAGRRRAIVLRRRRSALDAR